MLYLKIHFFCNFRLQRALELKLYPKLVNMGRSFVQSFSSIALRNQKIWNFLCLQAKNSYRPYLFDLFWKNQKIPCFWARKKNWSCIKTQNSTGNRFLALLERLDKYFPSKIRFFSQNMSISWISDTYRSQIWFYKKYLFIWIAESSQAEILLGSRSGLVVLSVQLQLQHTPHSKDMRIFVFDLDPAVIHLFKAFCSKNHENFRKIHVLELEK